MKTIITLLLLATFITSCKKDYVCTCTTPSFMPGTPPSVSKYNIHATERGAKKQCKKYENPNNNWVSFTKCQL